MINQLAPTKIWTSFREVFDFIIPFVFNIPSINRTRNI